MLLFVLKIYVENVDFVKKGFIFAAKCVILYENADNDYNGVFDLLPELTLKRIWTDILPQDQTAPDGAAGH